MLSAASLALMVSLGTVYAQDVDELPEADDVAEAAQDQIVVTGSRIARDEFSSAAPLQSLDAGVAREIGFTSVSDLLQNATVASGQQIDATLNTNAGNSNATEAPPTGGTGSSNINLRGLGAERTLVLLNGRRFGPSGVRGAPAQPDINLLPLSIIERVEIITEGASSVYGADAVAGVANVILRSEFEGLEISGSLQRPEEDGGDVSQISFVTGSIGERSSILFAGEYFNRERIQAGQRDFSDSFDAVEIAEDGSIIRYPRSGFFDNTVLAVGEPGDSTGSIFYFYTPGSTNIGVQDFSNFLALPEPDGPCTLEGNQGDFVCFDEFNDQDERRRADLVQPVERFSFVTTGTFDLDFFGEDQVYFEGYYLNRNAQVRAAIEQIFPDIPALIPQLDASGAVVGLVDNPLSPFNVDAAPIITLTDIPQDFQVELQQIRFVTGLRGDLPAGVLAEKNWDYDVTFTYDRGTGFQSQTILLEPHLLAATQGVFLNADGTLGCGVDDQIGLGGFFTIAECVPFQAFAPSVYATGPVDDGSFATQAERDYLLGNRTNRTVTEQIVYSGFLTGDLFDIPGGGTVASAFGGEFRRDKIQSQNDIVGVLGLNAAENPVQEGETVGKRDIWDIYGEVTLPLIVDKPFVHLAQVEGAVRYTNEENFGDEVTYRARILYAPTDWIRISGSYGTSFRAPNLREQFLAAQGGGIGGGADPCLNNNISQLDATDPDVQVLINNCVASGVVFTDELDANGNPGSDGLLDTTVLGTQGVTTIPIRIGGNDELEAETSRSFTGTLSVSPPIFENIDVDFVVSYYDIAIENSVNPVDASDAIGRCYNDPNFPNLSSPFCSLVTRPVTNNPAGDIINFVDASFINIGEDTAKGLDFNSRIQFSLDDLFGGAPAIDLSWATATTYVLEREIETFGPEDREDLVGRIAFPEVRFTSTVSAEFKNFRLLASSRMQSSQQQPNTEALRDSTEIEGTLLSRDVDFTDQYWVHDMSLSYHTDAWSITSGVRNIANTEPPIIDPSEGPNRNGAVSSTGFDFIGRNFFVSGTVRF